MISDTLAEAIEDIENYQSRIADAYNNPAVVAEIEEVKAKMAALMRKLSNPIGFFDIQNKASYLECPVCQMDKVFQIDLAEPSKGYCHIEKKVWDIKKGNRAE